MTCQRSFDAPMRDDFVLRWLDDMADVAPDEDLPCPGRRLGRESAASE